MLGGGDEGNVGCDKAHVPGRFSARQGDASWEVMAQHSQTGACSSLGADHIPSK